MKVYVEDAKGELLMSHTGIDSTMLVQDFKKMLLTEAPKVSK